MWFNQWAGKNIIRTICGAVLSALLVALLLVNVISSALRFYKWSYLNDICLQRSTNRAGVSVFPYPCCLELSAVDRACDLYLQSYFVSLGPGGLDQMNLARNCEMEADGLVRGASFASCIHSLNTTACFCEYALDFPLLAETYLRCAVSQCRRHAEEARIKAAGGAEIGRSYYLLANEAQELAEIFCRHDKLEIADRAYQDAIASALTAARSDNRSGHEGEDLQRYFLAYVAFLYAHHRDEDALVVLVNMDKVCK